MKYIKVTVEAFYEVPDDLEITTHPGDDLECIQIEGRHYIPMIDWLEREESGVWGTVDYDVVELCSEETTMTEVSREEFNKIFITGGEEE